MKESDAYPALPEDGYGWEKLFSERMCRHFEEDFGMQCRVARYHNVYGPLGTWTGGREKAPAAICRKVLEAKLSGKHEIEIWGDGNQTRSFMYIDDCTKGTRAITESDIHEPLNLGSNELVTINQLVDIVEEIAGVKLKRRYKLDAPKGVNGRNSDNAKDSRVSGLGTFDPSQETASKKPTNGLRKKCSPLPMSELALQAGDPINRQLITGEIANERKPRTSVRSWESTSTWEMCRARFGGWQMVACLSCPLHLL